MSRARGAASSHTERHAKGLAFIPKKIEICGMSQGGSKTSASQSSCLPSMRLQATRTLPCAAGTRRSRLLPDRPRPTTPQQVQLQTMHALPEAASQAAVAVAAAAATAASASEGSSTSPAVYGGLGLAAATFLGTFFVLPRFGELLKEPEAWSTMYKYLVQAGSVKQLAPEEAYARAKKGAVLLDVRLAQRYADLHAERSVSVPLYRPIQDWDLPSNLRRLAFSLFGIFPGTELNPEFLDQAFAAAPKGKEVIVLCESGGSLDTKPGVTYGFQSRSLKAAYFLLKAGYTKVSFCQGGFQQWQREGLPVQEGDDPGAGYAEEKEQADTIQTQLGRLFGK